MSAVDLSRVEAHHLRALKNADDITFHFHDGRSYIRAHRRSEHTVSGFEERVDVPAETQITNYESGRVAEPVASGFHMWFSPKLDLTAQSLLRRIRTGDTLYLKWVAGNDNDNLREIGWHCDELYLGIHHERGGADERYLVTRSVGPDNTARMVKHS